MFSHSLGLVHAPAFLLYFYQFPYDMVKGNRPLFLLHFAQWLGQQQYSITLSGSTWTFPYCQFIHYTGISIWLGTNILIDLRFLGFIRKNQNAAEFTHNLVWLNWTGLVIVLTGGFLLFSGNPETYFLNVAFRLKFPLLVFGIFYHAFLQWRQLKWGRRDVIPDIAKYACWLEILIWIGVVTLATRIPNQ